MKSGDTFHGGAPNSPPHFWIVLTEPDEDGNVVIVNFTSHRAGCDETCVVDVGDHLFIKKKTVLNYAAAQLSPIAKLLQGEKKNVIEMRAPVSPVLLERIRHGALASEHTPLKVAKRIKVELERNRS